MLLLERRKVVLSARSWRPRGVYARAQSTKSLDEEQPEAYKDVSEVVEVLHNAGISKKVAKLRPLGVIKG